MVTPAIPLQTSLLTTPAIIPARTSTPALNTPLRTKRFELI
jgi:hypothetical protein